MTHPHDIADAPPVRVVIEKNEANVENYPPEFNSFLTIVFAGIPAETGPGAQRILPTAKKRSKAIIQCFANNTAAGASNTTTGAVTSVGAAGVITSQVLAAGTYNLQWQVQLVGAAAAADANNFQVTVGATQVAVSQNSGAAGTYPQPSLTIVIPAGGATVAIKSIGAGTVGVTYGAQLTTALQPSNVQGFVWIGSKERVQNANGGKLYPGQKVDITAQQEVWVAGDGVSPLTVLVYEERYR